MIIKTVSDGVTEYCAVTAIEKDTQGRVLAYYLSRSKYSAYWTEIDEKGNAIIFDEFSIVDDAIPDFWVSDEKTSVTSFPEWIKHKEIVRYYSGEDDFNPEVAKYIPIFEKYYEKIVEDYIVRNYDSVANFHKIASKKSKFDTTKIKLADLMINEIVKAKLWSRDAKPKKTNLKTHKYLLEPLHPRLLEYFVPIYKQSLE